MDIKNKKFHFIAIGGVGMSGLAKYLAERGASVSGSDIQESKYTHLLESKGIKVAIGHNKDLITNDMTIIASSAIKQTNPEIIRAKELNLKIYHRSDILKMISDEFANKKESYFIGFSGTHGKTTTSGLFSYVLSKGGLHPSYIVGGIIPEIETNGTYDGEKYFCAELDESDGTIEKYNTDIAVINNMEEDHLDHYKNGFEDIMLTFNKYLSNNKSQKVIINIDNSGNKKFIEKYKEYNYITFGEKDADYTPVNIEFKGFCSQFDILYKGKFLDTIKLSIPGMHNVYNALAVYVSMKEMNINTQNLIEHFQTFSGMGRRFQKVCTLDKIDIYDDYAHHPSEIKTTLKSISEGKEQNRRLVAIFQPHRYSRLKSLWNEFKTCFEYADKLIITDVFPAGEDEIDNINSKIFSQEITHKDSVYIQGKIENCADKILTLIKENDIVITLGAGTVTKLGKLIENEFKKGK